MPYSEDETRRFRPENADDIRRRQAEQRAAEERYDRAAEDRRIREYAARKERERQAQRDRERRERQYRNDTRRKQAARQEARRRKAARAKQKQKDLLLQEAAEGTTLAGKLFITPMQRMTILRWTLCALIFFGVLVFQNVIFSRITVFGCVINFIPAAILLISLTTNIEGGCVFALCASLFWSFSGAVLGSVSIFLLTAEAVFLGALRKSCFPKNLTSIMLCCFIGLVVHEAARFFLALFLGYTPWTFWYQVFVTTFFSFLICPVLYPLIRAVGRVGGSQWND